MSYRDTAHLGDYAGAVEGALSELREEHVVQRMWDGDHTVWGPEPDEIANRLGWLYSPENSEKAMPEIQGLAEAAREEGFENILLLGMGGSSLAPEVFSFALKGKDGYPDLAVLDSTDPEAVLRHAENLDLSRTLFVVSTKSGGTVETFSFFKFFYNKVMDLVGQEKVGSHFVAITDPGSDLQDTAEKYGFRATFKNDPNIGGRYSALSFFGIVPAAISGASVSKLLSNAGEMARECGPEQDENPGAWLGVIMGELARSAGRDKLTLLSSPSVEAFGPWVEQLIAESTGKNGVGILPVDGEPTVSADDYGNDRLFVSMKLSGEEAADGLLEELKGAGHPVVEIELDDAYDLGGEMLRWEVATAIAGWRLGINPFDQPNVESAKIQARNMVEEYAEKGELPQSEATVEEDGLTVYSSQSASSAEEAIESFLSQAKSGDYVSLQAYLPPSDATTETLQEMRVRLLKKLGVATTSGYGPRFLHSTGQLHKGDGGNGLFVQFTADNEQDADIPDEAGSPASGMSFGVLEEAQALGDRQALLDVDRRVIRIHLGSDVSGGLKRVSELFG